MKDRLAVLVLVGLSLLPATRSASGQIRTADIEVVRNKSVLESRDLEIIDSFVADAVQQLLLGNDFASVAAIRRIIKVNSASNQPSAAEQYARSFFQAADRSLSEAFQQASKQPDDQRRFLLSVNLLILMDTLLDQPHIVKAAEVSYLNMIKVASSLTNSKNAVLKYWAVKCLAKPVIAAHSPNAAREIFRQLEAVSTDKDPFLLGLVVEFVSRAKDPQAEKLLTTIADMRMKAYENGTVENDFIDGDILKALYARLETAPPSQTAAIAQRFGQLYSYLIQKYIRDINDGGSLSEDEKTGLVSSILEVEKISMSRLIGQPQVRMKTAIERGDLAALQKIHDELLGSQAGAGLLQAKYAFQYRGGSTAPNVLPAKLKGPPPAAK